MTYPDEAGSLRGLGPKSQAMLARAGIATAAELRRIGSVAAYVKVKQAGCNASLNLLWGLESVLCGLAWQEVARVHRASLLLALEEQERPRRHSEAKQPGTSRHS